LPVTGVVDSTTANAIGESIRLGMIPDWFNGDMGSGATGTAVTRLRALLGLPDGDRFDAPVEAAVRRFQSAHHLPLTGVMGDADATVLGDDAPWKVA